VRNIRIVSTESSKKHQYSRSKFSKKNQYSKSKFSKKYQYLTIFPRVSNACMLIV
jgi:hypothetical protein